MLAAHHDSVPHGPGAGDDAAAVGAILETCRAVTAGAALKRDVLVVLTDGEELGLVGARALFASDAKVLRKYFAATRPTDESVGLAAGGRRLWEGPRDGIGVAMNFEGRGTGGPSLMFETGPGNARVIREFAAGDPWPYANSLSYDVYRMLPNDTDFTVFRRPVDMGGGAMQGLNFAFISNYFWYHTRNDTPENLSAASAYHHGTHALAMARRFGNLSAEALRGIRDPAGPNAVYFNVGRGTLVWYPATWVWPLVIVQGVLGVCAIVVGFWRGVMTGRGVVGGVVRLVAALALTPAAVYGLMLMLRAPQSPGAFWGQVAGVMALAVVITATVALTPVRFMRREAGVVRGRRVGSFAGVVLLFLTGLSAASAVYAPGGSFLVAWPGIVLALGVIVAGLGRGRDASEEEGEDATRRAGGLRSPGSAGVWAAVAVLVVAPAIVLWGPLLVQLFTALTLQMAWACSVGVVVATVIVVAGFTPLAIAGGGPGGRSGATRIDPA
jgi:hypothetical protein